jgi:hypothetical protein
MRDLHADVAQLVERELPKLEVAGSRPVVRFSRRSQSQIGTGFEPGEEFGFVTRVALGRLLARVPAAIARYRQI